eukprot:COSAG05_NODE_20151_length_282_cov_1.043716_1_plen_36_part_01
MLAHVCELYLPTFGGGDEDLGNIRGNSRVCGLDDRL